MNSYYDLAEDDLFEAEDRYNAGRYNKCAVWCQQAGEKYLKYILVDKLGVDATDDAVSSHNLRRIFERINRDRKNLDIPASALYSLNSFYTKARYPGEGFVEVDRETAAELLEHLKTIKTAVDAYITEAFSDNLSALTARFGNKASGTVNPYPGNPD